MTSIIIDKRLLRSPNPERPILLRPAGPATFPAARR